MARVIERVPTQIEIALDQELPAIPRGPFHRVVVAGMGGSALPTDIVVDVFADKLRVPVVVCRTYNLPREVDERTLVIASSFSGGTEEVLAAVERFPTKAPNVAVICSGGALGQWGQSHELPVILIPAHEEPPGFQPRCAIGYNVGFLARLLHSAGVMDDPTAELGAIPGFLRKTDARPAAEKAASWLADKIPAVYTDETHVLSVARVTKIKFNENAKRPALFNAFPESNHNEMIGFSNGMARFGLLYLDDPASHPRIRRRFETMRQAFKADGLSHVAFHDWTMPGTTNMERVFGALQFADWCSYTLALLDGVDPTPVALVERFKKLLVENKA